MSAFSSGSIRSIVRSIRSGFSGRSARSGRSGMGLPGEGDGETSELTVRRRQGEDPSGVRGKLVSGTDRSGSGGPTLVELDPLAEHFTFVGIQLAALGGRTGDLVEPLAQAPG